MFLNLVQNHLQLGGGQVTLLESLNRAFQTVHTPGPVLDFTSSVPVQGLAVLLSSVPVTLVVTLVRPKILSVTLFE